ncbi:MAG: VWA domain-containing protein, partial [Verrucomicrobiota bacterium]
TRRPLMTLIASNLSTLHFGHPWFLLLLGLLPLAYFLRGKPGHIFAVRFSSLALLKELGASTNLHPRKLLTLLRYLSIALLILAIARPRVDQGTKPEESEGIDIMFVLDYSDSMKAEDFVLNAQSLSRLAALQHVTKEFLKNRPNDKIGVIGFAAEPYLISPLTIDHDWALEMMEYAKTSGGTAIGSGIVAATNLLGQSDTKTKVQIVVTDGLSNTGVPPLEAGKYAKNENIRVYPIEILNYRNLRGRANKVLEHPLYQIADLTGGQFFQASDYDSLRLIYSQIDQLEKSLIKQKTFKVYQELFSWFLWPALFFIFLEFSLSKTLWLKLP